MGLRNRIKKRVTRLKNRLTGQRMVVMASTNNIEEKKVETFFNAPISYEPLTKLNILFPKCGHLGPSKATLNIYGTIMNFDVDKNIKNVNGQITADSEKCPCPECCFNYYKEKSIRCALCGTGITPGDGVAIYSYKTSPEGKEQEANPHFRMDLATKIGGNVVGCIRWDCCPSGGFFAGHWGDQGFEPAFPNGNCAAGLAALTGNPILVNTDKK